MREQAARGRSDHCTQSCVTTLGERSDWLRALRGRSCVNRPLGGALTQSQSCVAITKGVSETSTNYLCYIYIVHLFIITFYYILKFTFLI